MANCVCYFTPSVYFDTLNLIKKRHKSFNIGLEMIKCSCLNAISYPQSCIGSFKRIKTLTRLLLL